MNSKLFHRGPDSGKVWRDKNSGIVSQDKIDLFGEVLEKFKKE